MHLYEHIFICRPEISEARVNELTSEYRNHITGSGGEIGRCEYWGLRQTAYPIKKHNKAHYVLLDVKLPEPKSTMKELERMQNLNEDVLRSFSVRVHALETSPSIPKQQKDTPEPSESTHRRPPRSHGAHSH